MRNQTPSRWFGTPVVWLLQAAVMTSIAMLAATAMADTIYLKNGRVFHTDRAQVVDDQVVFTQYGAAMAIPMNLVERVERDDQTSPEPTRASGNGDASSAASDEAGPSPGAAAVGGASGDEASPGEAAGEQAEAGGAAVDKEAQGTGSDQPVAPEKTRKYWQQRVLAISSQIIDVQRQIDRLPINKGLESYAELRPGQDVRGRLEMRLLRLQQELGALKRAARRAGIPAGWLRVRR